MREIKNSHKLLIGATTAAVLAGVVGTGSYATWGDAENSTADVASGTFQLAVNGMENGQSIELKVENFAPGDRLARPVVLENKGSVDFASIEGVLTGTSNGALLDGTSKGLQVQVLECDIPWIKSTSNTKLSNDGYLCGTYTRTSPWYTLGTKDTIRPQAPFSAAPTSVKNGDLVNGEKAHLLVTVSLPASTGDDQTVNSGSDYASYGNKTASITYTFTAKQRAGNLLRLNETDANDTELTAPTAPPAS